MEQTPPPDVLAYNQGGSNHTLHASDEICAKCHGEAFDAEGVQAGVEGALDDLQGLIEEALVSLMGDQIALGNTIDLAGQATVTDTRTSRTSRRSCSAKPVDGRPLP